MRNVFDRLFSERVCVSEIFDSETYSLLPKVASLRLYHTWLLIG